MAHHIFWDPCHKRLLIIFCNYIMKRNPSFLLRYSTTKLNMNTSFVLMAATLRIHYEPQQMNVIKKRIQILNESKTLQINNRSSYVQESVSLMLKISFKTIQDLNKDRIEQIPNYAEFSKFISIWIKLTWPMSSRSELVFEISDTVLAVRSMYEKDRYQTENFRTNPSNRLVKISFQYVFPRWTTTSLYCFTWSAFFHEQRRLTLQLRCIVLFIDMTKRSVLMPYRSHKSRSLSLPVLSTVNILFTD